MSDDHESGVDAHPRPQTLLVRTLTAVSATLMFALMALTFVDVVGRYGFNSPIGATFEIIEMLLGLLIFSALPLVTRNQGHITVSLFERFFHGRLGWYQHLFVLVFSTGAVAFMTYRLWAEMLIMRDDQDVGEYLDIELWPVIGGITALSAITFFILVGLLIDYMRGRLESESHSSLGERL